MSYAEVTVIDSCEDLFTARMRSDHAIGLMNRGSLQRRPVYGEVDGVFKEVGTRLEINHIKFIEYIREVAI